MRRIALVALLLASCNDPVRDRKIAELGGEDPAIPVGPLHRAGQPCLLCHSDGGPAGDKPFAIAGTIFATNAPGSPGQKDVLVRFVDGSGGFPNFDPVTNESGNFFVRVDDWPKLTFPARVAIFPPGKPAQPMASTINREGSCNACHQPNIAPPFSSDDADYNAQSIGQIFVEAK